MGRAGIRTAYGTRQLIAFSDLVGTLLEFAAFGGGPSVKYSRASAFCFFCSQPWFLRRSEHIFPAETPVFIRHPCSSRNR